MKLEDYLISGFLIVWLTIDKILVYTPAGKRQKEEELRHRVMKYYFENFQQYNKEKMHDLLLDFSLHTQISPAEVFKAFPALDTEQQIYFIQEKTA